MALSILIFFGISTTIACEQENGYRSHIFTVSSSYGTHLTSASLANPNSSLPLLNCQPLPLPLTSTQPTSPPAYHHPPPRLPAAGPDQPDAPPSGTCPPPTNCTYTTTPPNFPAPEGWCNGSLHKSINSSTGGPCVPVTLFPQLILLPFSEGSSAHRHKRAVFLPFILGLSLTTSLLGSGLGAASLGYSVSQFSDLKIPSP